MHVHIKKFFFKCCLPLPSFSSIPGYFSFGCQIFIRFMKNSGSLEQDYVWLLCYLKYQVLAKLQTAICIITLWTSSYYQKKKKRERGQITNIGKYFCSCSVFALTFSSIFPTNHQSNFCNSWNKISVFNTIKF